jgi:hypothetical protein
MKSTRFLLKIPDSFGLILTSPSRSLFSPLSFCLLSCICFLSLYSISFSCFFFPVLYIRCQYIDTEKYLRSLLSLFISFLRHFCVMIISRDGLSLVDTPWMRLGKWVGSRGGKPAGYVPRCWKGKDGGNWDEVVTLASGLE